MILVQVVQEQKKVLDRNGLGDRFNTPWDNILLLFFFCFFLFSHSKASDVTLPLFPISVFVKNSNIDLSVKNLSFHVFVNFKIDRPTIITYFNSMPGITARDPGYNSDWRG